MFKRIFGILAAVVGLWLSSAAPSLAQVFVVQSCGTVPASMKVLSAGNPGMFFTDTTGVLCTSAGGGGGGGLSVTDQAAWTQGTSAFTPGGGIFNDTATLSSGQQGTFRMTTKRAQIIDADTSGNALYSALTAAAPCLNATAFNTNTYTTGQTNPLNCDVNGNLYVNAKVASLPATPAGTNRVGYTSDDPCTQKIKLNAPFSTSSGGPVSIVALSGSTVIYICSISAITDTAIKLSFIDGTGGSCASAQHAIWGSTTAANGMSLAANGGFTMGSGNGSVGVTTAASALCLLQSGTSLVAGNVTYVQQ